MFGGYIAAEAQKIHDLAKGFGWLFSPPQDRQIA
jgi:hypothetical protein